MQDCLFCKIARGDIPSQKVFEDDRILAFYDVSPQAPVHVLIIPKEHIDSMDALSAEQESLAGYMLRITRDIAKDLNLAEGYRAVINTGADGGQTVPHLHIHLLGGRELQWPPG